MFGVTVQNKTLKSIFLSTVFPVKMQPQVHYLLIYSDENML